MSLCGLSREEILEVGCIKQQRCQAIYVNANGEEAVCDRLFSQHPSGTGAMKQIIDKMDKVLLQQEELTNVQKVLADGQKVLTDGQKVLTDGQKVLTDGQQELVDGQKALADGQQELADNLKAANLVLYAVTEPKVASTSSMREQNQTIFKDNLRKYYECVSPTNAAVTRCLVLNHYFSTNDVIAAHIINLNDVNLCNLFSVESIWNERNGLLLYKSIAKQFNAFHLTFLLDPDTSVFYVKVLYDHVLSLDVGIERRTIGLTGKEKLTFNDIQNKPLYLPVLKFPSKKTLVRHAYRAFKNATSSTLYVNNIANTLMPNPEQWEKIFNHLKQNSPKSNEIFYLLKF